MEDELEQALRRERLSPELVSLPDDFYPRLSQFLSSLASEQAEGLKKEVLEEKRKTVLRMARELIDLRVRKALFPLLEGKQVGLLPTERSHLEEAVGAIRRMHESLLCQVPAREPQTRLVLIREKIPRIVAEDMKFYGPFAAGDVAAIPRRTAELLAKKNLVHMLEVRI